MNSISNLIHSGGCSINGISTTLNMLHIRLYFLDLPPKLTYVCCMCSKLRRRICTFVKLLLLHICLLHIHAFHLWANFSKVHQGVLRSLKIDCGLLNFGIKVNPLLSIALHTLQHVYIRLLHRSLHFIYDFSHFVLDLKHNKVHVLLHLSFIRLFCQTFRIFHLL